MKHETENILKQVQRAFADARSHGATIVGEDPFYKKGDDPEPRPPEPSTPPAPTPNAKRIVPQRKRESSQTLIELTAPLIKLLENDLGNIVLQHHNTMNVHEIMPSHLDYKKGTLDKRCKSLYGEAIKSLGSGEKQ